MDSFGVSMELTIFNHKKQRTVYGALLTLAVIILLIVKASYLIVRLAVQAETTFHLFKIPDIDTPLQLKQFTLHICPVNQNDVSMWTFGKMINSNNPSGNPIEPYQCLLTSTDDSLSNLFKNCYCYDLETHNLTDSNNIKNITTSIGSISYTKPSNSSSSQNLSSDVYLFYTKLYVDYYDNYLIARKIQQMHFIQNVSGQHFEVDFFAEKIRIEKEWLNIVQLKFIQSVDSITHIQSVNIRSTKKENENGGVINLQFVHSGWLKKYTFIQVQWDKVVADFGGYCQFILFCFSVLGHLLNNCALKDKIYKKIYEKRKHTKKIDLNEIKNNKFDLENLRTEQQLICIGQELNNHNNKTLHRSFDCRQQLPLSLRTPKIEIKRNLNYNPVNQFYTYLDLGNLFQIIQEVKLLELLCLKPSDAILFFKCKKCEIDLKRLEKYTKSTSLSWSNKYSMESFKNKIDIIQDCLIK